MCNFFRHGKGNNNNSIHFFGYFWCHLRISSCSPCVVNQKGKKVWLSNFIAPFIYRIITFFHKKIPLLSRKWNGKEQSRHAHIVPSISIHFISSSPDVFWHQIRIKTIYFKGLNWKNKLPIARKMFIFQLAWKVCNPFALKSVNCHIKQSFFKKITRHFSFWPCLKIFEIQRLKFHLRRLIILK